MDHNSWTAALRLAHDVLRRLRRGQIAPAIREADPATLVLADRFSCRTQIRDLRPGAAPLHGAQVLAAAVICARAGLDIQVLEDQPTPGGGCRTEEIALAGVAPSRDICSAVHPIAAASPFFTAFDLAARGGCLNVPTVSSVHPLDHRPAGIAYPDLERTVAELAEYGFRADAAGRI